MLEQAIKNLTEATDELRTEIENLTAALKAQSGAATPAAPAAPKPQADDAPTEDLKPMVLKMSRTGHKEVMRKKMDSYGASKLDDLTAEQAIDFLAWLKILETK